MCIQWTRVVYSVVKHRHSLIHLFHNSTVRVMNSRLSGQCLYTILDIRYLHLITQSAHLLPLPTVCVFISSLYTHIHTHTHTHTHTLPAVCVFEYRFHNNFQLFVSLNLVCTFIPAVRVFESRLHTNYQLFKCCVHTLYPLFCLYLSISQMPQLCLCVNVFCFTFQKRNRSITTNRSQRSKAMTDTGQR